MRCSARWAPKASVAVRTVAASTAASRQSSRARLSPKASAAVGEADPAVADQRLLGDDAQVPGQALGAEAAVEVRAEAADVAIRRAARAPVPPAAR